MKSNLKQLPLGESTFKDIILKNKLYIDKTEEIYKLLENSGKYYFLSRPRRFGKSLLVSTLDAIFKGEKELFKDLYIYDKIDFKKYPIIRIDFNNVDMSTPEKLAYHLEYQLEKIATANNISFDKERDFKSKFEELILELSKIEKVVVLIDEYDKPIIDHIDNIPIAVQNRSILKTFYGTLKGMDAYLHFVFITGISKFSKVSIFSELNNLTDITMDKNHSKILGIEEKDVFSYFSDRISLLAQEKNVTEETLKITLKKMYNGYSWDGVNFLYNPYSLLLLFKNQEIKSYWFESGTPSFVPKLLKEFDLDINELDGCVLKEEDFSTYEIEKINPYAILFQAGYLTIKEIRQLDIKRRHYVLNYPNMEVKDAFLHAFLNEISYPNKKSGVSIDNMIDALEKKDLDKFFYNLITVFDSIPNQIHPEKSTPFRDKEFYYHTIFQVIFKVIGLTITSELSTSKGFVDSVIELDDKVYIFEFKMQKNPQIALNQIENKQYYNSYKACGKEIILVGVSFDMESRNVKEWLSC